MSGQASISMLILRLIAALFALPFSVYAARALLFALHGGGLLSLIVGSASLLVALLAWWFALRAQVASARAHMRHVCFGAALLGGISFLAVFFGPRIFMPQSNQGPLFGIFFTGPIGFTIGGILGALYSGVWLNRRAKPQQPALGTTDQSDS